MSWQPLVLIEEQEDYMYTFNGFLNGVGGNLGLFLGFSILSTVTQVLFLSTKISLWVNNKRMKKKQKKA